ncbi:MAG: hypothetical protein V7K99_24535 [Nostoc sp.]
MADLTFDKSIATSLYVSDDLHPIDLDDAWQWLGYTKKQTCLDNLRNYFVDDMDFLRAGVKSGNGRPSDIYLLSVDCFKMLGMMAGTPQGKLIRQWFLDIEREWKLAAVNPINQLSRYDDELNRLDEQKSILINQILIKEQELDALRNTYGDIEKRYSKLWLEKHPGIDKEYEKHKKIVEKDLPVKQVSQNILPENTSTIVQTVISDSPLVNMLTQYLNEELPKLVVVQSNNPFASKKNIITEDSFPESSVTNYLKDKAGYVLSKQQQAQIIQALNKLGFNYSKVGNEMRFTKNS